MGINRRIREALRLAGKAEDDATAAEGHVIAAQDRATAAENLAAATVDLADAGEDRARSPWRDLPPERS
jgi:hypothetical protein